MIRVNNSKNIDTNTYQNKIKLLFIALFTFLTLTQTTLALDISPLSTIYIKNSSGELSGKLFYNQNSIITNISATFFCIYKYTINSQVCEYLPEESKLSNTPAEIQQVNIINNDVSGIWTVVGGIQNKLTKLVSVVTGNNTKDILKEESIVSNSVDNQASTNTYNNIIANPNLNNNSNATQTNQSTILNPITYQVIERSVPGVRGPQGVAGTNGTNGINGTNGVSAPQANYIPGAQYISLGGGGGGGTGAQGPQGIQGIAGINGTTTIIFIAGSSTSPDITATGTSYLTTLYSSNFSASTTNSSTTNTNNLISNNSINTNSTSTNLFTTNLNSNNATNTNLFAQNANLTNATSTNFFSSLLNAVTGFFTNLTTTNLLATNSTTTNSTSTNLFSNLANFISANINTLFGNTSNFLTSNASTTNSTTTNTNTINANQANLSNVNVANNLVANNLSATGTSNLSNLTSNNATLTSATITNLSATNLLSSNATFTNLNVSNLSSNTINAIASSTTNTINYTANTNNNLVSNVNGIISTTSISRLNNLTLTGTTIADNINATNTTAVNGAIANLSAGNLQANQATLTNSTSTNLYSINASITNAITNDLFSTRALITNATTTSLFSNILTAVSGFFTNLTATNANIINGTIATLFGNTSNFVTSNASTTNSTTTNTVTLNSINANLLNASTSNLTSSNATVTNLTAINTVSTNGVFNNLTSTTTTLNGTTTFNGAIVNNSTTSNNSFFNLSSNNLSSVNSTSTNSTSTNLFSQNANLVNSTTTNANISNLTAANATTSNLFTTLLNAVTGFISNLFFTNATGTNIQLANTSTTNLTATGTSNLSNLISNNATITSATITNLNSSSLLTGLLNGYIWRGNASNQNEATSSLYIANDGKIGLGTTLPTANLSINQGTLTGASQEALKIIGTWNNIGSIYKGIDLDILTNNSNSLSTLLNLAVGGASIFKVKPNGEVTVTGTLGVTGTTTLNSQLDLSSNKIVNLLLPTNPNDAANKAYVDSFAQGVTYQKPVITISTTTAPLTPATGDRYILETGSSGYGACLPGQITEWTGLAWACTSPSTGTTAYVNSFFNQSYNYNGSTWVSLGSTVMHNVTQGLQGGNAGEYYHLNAGQYSDLNSVNAQLKQLQTTGTATQFVNLNLTGGLNISGANSGATITNATFTNIFVSNNASVTNSLSQNTIGTNATFTNLFTSKASITDIIVNNASTSNLFTNLLNAVSGFISNLFFTNATGTNIQLATINTTNLTATGTSNLTNLISNNATLTNASIANLSVNNLQSSLLNGFVYRGSTSNLTEATSSLFIANNGNLGVGTTAPNYQLSLSSENNSTAGFESNFFGVGNTRINFNKANGTALAPTAVTSGNRLAAINAAGFDGSTNVLGSAIQLEVDGAVSTGIVPGRINFITRDTLGAIGERMRITNNGNVGVGAIAPTERLEVNGNIKGDRFIGYGGGSITSNSAVGLNSLFSNTTGLGNTANGYESMLLNTGGQQNSSYGSFSLRSNTTGSDNTANGAASLLNNTIGNFNTANGLSSLYSNTAGSSNVASGRQSLYSNTTGNNNTANGLNSLYSNTIGDSNTANGLNSLYSNTAGIENIAVGNASIYSNTTGSYNVSLGSISGFDNTTGSDNSYIGYNTGRGITTGNFNTILGSNVIGLASGLSNNIILADGQGNRRINVDSAGNVGIGEAVPTAKLTVGSSLFGSALSNTLVTNAGALGITPGNTLNVANFGFTSVNSSSLGIRALRTAAGSDWTTSAITIGMDVDNTPSAGASLTLAANGNVGIGTSAPIGLLSLNRNALSSTIYDTYSPSGGTLRMIGADGLTNRLVIGTFGSNSAVDYLRTNGTAAAPTAILAGDRLGATVAGGYDGSAIAGSARISFDTTENWSPTARGTSITFDVTANGTNGTTRAMTINPNSSVSLSSTNSGTDINGAMLDIGQGGTGDSVVSYQVTGRRWYSGIDQSDSAKYKIASTLGIPSFDTDTKLTIDNNGNLGIGTSAPTAKLEITDSLNSILAFTVQDNEQPSTLTTLPGGFGLSISNNFTAGQAENNFINRDIVGARTRGFSFIQQTGVGTFSNPLMVIEGSTGNVGVGNDAPTSKLDVTGNIRSTSGVASGYAGLQPGNTTNSGYLELFSPGNVRTGYVGFNSVAPNGTMGIVSEGTNRLAFISGGLESLSVTPGGNVGVGTSAPGSKFEVNSGIAGISGLRFTNLLSSSATSTGNGKMLTVNASGDVILTDTPTAFTSDVNSLNVYNSSKFVSVQSTTTSYTSAVLGTTGATPYDLARDSSGNIYATARNSNNVTKITPAGVSTVFATTGAGPVGIAIDPAGNIYTANTDSNTVTKITPAGIATTLGFTSSQPINIVIDSTGNVYTSSFSSGDITKITPAGVSSTFASTGVASYGLAIDINNNVYTTNYGANTVTKITPAGVFTTLGTTGSNPYSLVLDSTGNVYTVNASSDNVTKITPAGVSTVFAIVGSSPRDIAIDSFDNLYTANSGSNNISKITPAGVVTTFATSAVAFGIIVDPIGDIYTTNFSANSVTKTSVIPGAYTGGVISSVNATSSTILASIMSMTSPLYIKPSIANSTYAAVGVASSTVIDALVVNGAIRARGFVVDSAADLAETFPTEGNVSIAPGTVVAFSDSLSDFKAGGIDDTNYLMSTIKIASPGDRAVGVIATNPGFLLGGKNGSPVTFQGRIPVTVSNENGLIKRGDRITLSTTTPGIAIKQSEAGNSLGIALSDDTGSGKVLILVDTGFSIIDKAKDNPIETEDVISSTTIQNLISNQSGLQSVLQSTLQISFDPLNFQDLGTRFSNMLGEVVRVVNELLERMTRVESEVSQLKQRVRVLEQGQGVNQGSGGNPNWSGGNTSTTTITEVISTTTIPLVCTLPEILNQAGTACTAPVTSLATTTPQLTFDPLSCILPQVANLTLSVCE